MGVLHLETSSHASFASLIWGGSAGAPYDLHLVTEDGKIEAHCAMLFPLSRYLTAIETLPYSAAPVQVVLAGTSIRAVAAAKDLIYTGTCYLDKLTLPEFLETLAILGVEVSSKSFSFKTKFTDWKRSASNHPSSEILEFGDVKEASVSACEENSGDIDDPLDIKEETEDVVEALEGITVGEAFHVESCLNTICSRLNMGKINKEVQVKIPKLKIVGKRSLDIKERIFACHVKGCKLFKNKLSLESHVKIVHFKEKSHQCHCLKKFISKKNLNRHLKIVHKIEERDADSRPRFHVSPGAEGRQTRLDELWNWIGGRGSEEN